MSEMIERGEAKGEKLKWWAEGLSHKDWLFDGSPIKSDVAIARFNNLDWENAWLDMGPSIAGNLGPYWHVPLKETVINGEVYDFGDTVHRLYPKVLDSKWLWVIRQACEETAKRCDPENLRKKVETLSLELASLKYAALSSEKE